MATAGGSRFRGALATLALVAAMGLAAAARAEAAGVYVALGDSYTSGPLIPNPKGDPIDCGQSDRNYPTLTARAIAPSVFVDVSCGSAQTRHMTEPQDELPLGGTNPPQFNGLRRDAELVTLGIGGNDMGFGGIVNKCVELGFQSAGMGKPCTDHYTAGGRDQIAERLRDVVAPRLARVIDQVHARTARARLLVVGYPDPLPEPPGCYPALPVSPGDLPYLHAVARRLSETVRVAAVDGGAEFVDLVPGSAGHDFCQPPGAKWYEGVVLTAPAYPAHPNALGMEFAAREVLAALRRPVPNDFSILGVRRLRGGTVVVRVRVPRRGALRVQGTARTRYPGGVRRRRARVVGYGAAHATAPRPAELAVRVVPRRSARRALRRARRLYVRLRIAWEPVAGATRTKTWIARVSAPRRTNG